MLELSGDEWGFKHVLVSGKKLGMTLFRVPFDGYNDNLPEVGQFVTVGSPGWRTEWMVVEVEKHDDKVHMMVGCVEKTAWEEFHNVEQKLDEVHGG